MDVFSRLAGNLCFDGCFFFCFNVERYAILRTLRQRLRQAETELSALAARLELLSPLQTLNRGYAVVSCEGRAVRDAARLAIGQTVDIRLAQGRARARIEHTEED